MSGADQVSQCGRDGGSGPAAGERNLDGASGCMRQAIVISALISVLSHGAFFWRQRRHCGLCGSMPDTLQDATAYFRWMLPDRRFSRFI